MLEPLLWNVYTHKSSCNKRGCPYHWSRISTLEPLTVRRSAGAPVCCTSIHGAKDDCPTAFPNRLRICRLMYKPLPHGSSKLNQRHYRNRRLALVKKKAIKLSQTLAARRAIPQYFQKRIKQRLLAKKTALPNNCPTESAPSACEPSVANGEEVVDDRNAEPPEVEHCDTSVPTQEVDPIAPTAHIDADSVDNKVATVTSPKGSALERADVLKTIKEYYSIQCAIRLLLSMLQERMEEVQTMRKVVVPASEEEMEDKPAPLMINDVEPNGDLTETDPESKEEIVKDEPEKTPERITKDCDPNKENNVPLVSTAESMSPATVALNRVYNTPSKEEPKEDSKPYSFLETSKSDILDPSYTCDIELEPLEKRKNRSIVDSLLNKFNLSPPVKATVPSTFSDIGMDTLDGRRSLRDRTKIAARPRYSEIPEEPRKMRVSKVFGKLHKTLNIDLDCTNSNSSTEFYGFDEGEVVKLDKPSLPGLLPTPIVKKSQPFAPFLAYGSSIEAEQNQSDTETRSDLFREEGLISFGSVPPRLECPQRPNDMIRPRTVAEKRILVSAQKDIRYVMIDNESKIFHFIKKRSMNFDASLDYCRMKELQDQRIPFTYGTWRALSWLRTEKGNYYLRTINIDNRMIRLTACLGNHKLRPLFRFPLYSSPVIASRGHRYHYVSNCRCPPFPEGVVLNISQAARTEKKEQEDASSGQRLQPYDSRKYLYHGSSNNTEYQSKRSYPGTKPGPLSSKCLQPSSDEDPSLGPLEVFKMPKVELEVFPKINRPLDGYVKPYLKMILPHDDITENWARFAVSTLTAPKQAAEANKALTDENEERSFVFELPYANDQRRMLIRRRLLASPGAPVNVDVERFTKLMDEKLTFRKTIDEALAGGDRDQIDPDELVCADMLSAITDSVALALAEDVFVKDDPDIEYAKKRDNIRSFNEQLSVPIKIDTSEHDGAADVKVITKSPTVPVSNEASSDADTMAAFECSKAVDPAKAKLLREMKRLNATIIEGPSEPTQSTSEPCRQQRCDPEYCSKGCLCDVLSSTQSVSVANISRKQHCDQIDCIFGCTCGFAEHQTNMTHQTKVDHGEDEEGETSLSRAEQRYLREKATARLAKEEREFTPTVILTKNTTVLVQNKVSECRRLKKKPKKYDDYYNDQSVQCLLNGGSVTDVSGYISKPPPNAKPLTEVERMRHAHVLLNKLPPMPGIEPLCLIHMLYRCFCGGKATQGEPFSFTEENCIAIASRSSGSESSAPISTAIELTAAGRMMKGGGQTSAKNRTKDQEVREARIDTTANLTPLGNVRKRLYSFEKPQNDRNEGKVLKTQYGPIHRRRRDSSEESYKPPNERKVAKKNSKTTNDSSTVPYGGIIRARRASVAPGHMYARPDSTIRRPSIAMQPAPPVVNKKLSLAMRRASVASPHLMVQRECLQKPGKSANASSRRSEEPDTVDNSLYTIVKPKKDSGSSKINNLILKRVTTQTAFTEPTTPPHHSKTTSAKQTTPLNKTTSPIKAQSNKLNAPSVPGVTKTMSVRELKQLLMRECKNSTEDKDTPSGSKVQRSVENILLVDTEENIDNEPRLNILSEGTKKLVISGKRRSFVENSEFRNGYPPARTIQCANRTVYVVAMPSEDDTPEAKSKEPQSPGIKKSNYQTLRQSTDEFGDSRLNDDPFRNHPKQLGVAAQKNQPVQPSEGETTVKKTDRLLCSLMYHINELLRRDNLDISPGKKGILHICRWKQLLNSFALGEIDVLDLTLTNGTEMTIITKNPSEQQLVRNVKCRVSATRLTIDKLMDVENPSLLMKMLVCQVDNVKMNNLALVLYGSDKFWHFCGFLKANERSFRSDSNVLTNPSKLGTAKIKMRLKEYYQKTSPSHDGQQTHKQTPSTVTLSTKSNVEILPKALQQVHFPLGLLPGLAENPNGDCCRWMRLKIENDFSHMYLQSWQCCITYGTVKKAIYDANRLGKPICLEIPVPKEHFKTQLLPYVYALPKEGHALFLGPYRSTETKVDVILCQSVEGSLYEREVYETLHGIQTSGNTKRTSGWWVDAVTSRVASVNMRNMLPKQPKKAVDTIKASPPVPSTAQRSLLKRNNMPSSAVATTSRANDTTIINKTAEKTSQDDSDSDDVVVLETPSDENITILSAKDMVGAQENSATNGQPPRKPFSVEQNAVDLLKLVQGTMRQNQQKKREIALSLELQRASMVQTSQGVGLNDQNRKRSSTGDTSQPVVEFAVPSKLPRRSDSIVESGTVKHNQQQQYPSTSGVRITPNATIQSNNFRRLSMSGPHLLNRHSGTATITPFKSPETTVSTKTAQSLARPSHTLNSQDIQERKISPKSTVQSNCSRRFSLSDSGSLRIAPTITRNNGTAGTNTSSLRTSDTIIPAKMAQNSTRPSQTQMLAQRNLNGTVEPHTSTARPPIPRGRLNSVAVERFNRSPPTMLQVADEEEDDVVLLDDDDDDDVEVKLDRGTAVKPSFSTEDLQRLLPKTTSIGVLNGSGAQPSGQQTLLSKEQLQMISRKLDLKKTGQQDGYNYNRAEGVLKISRSLLNTLQRDGILQQSVGKDLSSSENGTVVASNSKSSSSASTAPSTTTITMPRMKVVPRMLPVARVYEDVSTNRLPVRGTESSSNTAQSGPVGTNPAINLEYLNDEQKQKKIATLPNTKGVLESKIPGLGLVEAIRFNNQEVIINLKELTVKKQLVSVPNLEAAVNLLNQFISRNTYAFEPRNLVIKWQFKERLTAVVPEEKLTSIISQCCVVTSFGLVNLFKPDHIESIRQRVPDLYEDVLKLKLSMLCLDKKSYEVEQCHEYEDKIYERAFETIKSLEKKQSFLQRQFGHMSQLVKSKEAKLRKLQQVSSLSEPNNASGGGQESVIVIDDD
uniref:MGA conserved domain-containing protein n=1 Tax=Anopheles minimus TaxID=112268 RepID=A0A182WE80_9DIPT